MRYLCGVGSNIEPEDNLPRALALLADGLGCIQVSCVIWTHPAGMRSERPFLNTLLSFDSELSPEDLKHWLNEIEEVLGRDRSDPRRSEKDRPIDIDILEYRRDGAFSEVLEESYLRPLLSPDPPGVTSVQLGDQWLGEAPATVYRDEGAGHEVVVHQRQDLSNHGLEAAFPAQ